ncbi:hypothetical protein [Nocardia africana]|uniref:Uncharacterized protein n=1 Tax=Nocardia africana TaxID=134964 RepID=A0ABW6NU54_9NOCA
MTEPASVTVADTVRWLHEEGLVRLAGVGERSLHPIAAFTIDVATGMVGAHPASGAGSDVSTFAADDLPHPVGSPKRLVIVGVTTSEAMLVVDLAAALTISINADQPEAAARSWVLQLLLNPEITISTNSAEVAIGNSPRCRRSFIPGGGATIINIDDMNPPLTTVTLNGAEGPDHLDVEADGTGEMYLGSRFWSLRQVMTVGDAAWGALIDRMSETGESPGSDEPTPAAAVAPPAGAVASPPRGAFAPGLSEGR